MRRIASAVYVGSTVCASPADASAAGSPGSIGVGTTAVAVSGAVNLCITYSAAWSPGVASEPRIISVIFGRMVAADTRPSIVVFAVFVSCPSIEYLRLISSSYPSFEGTSFLLAHVFVESIGLTHRMKVIKSDEQKGRR